jgi:hypothetical protein
MKIILPFLLAASLFADDPAPTPTPPPDQTPAMEETSPPEQTPVSTMEETPPCEPEPCEEYGSFILNEFKMGYFRSGDKRFRHIYDDGLLDMQLTSSFCVWKPLYVYAAVEYIGAEGRSIGGHEKTYMRIIPLSLGLQYIQRIACDFKYYLTLGPRYFFFHQENHSHGVPRTVNKSGLGGFINTGFIYYLSHHITVGFFGEYSYKRMHFESHRKNVEGQSIQVGGLTIGGEIGYFW